VIAIRLWSVNHTLALAVLAAALVIFVSGLRRAESPSGGSPSPTRRIETVTMPAPVAEARPIEPDVGGAGGKLVVLAIVLLGVGVLLVLLFRTQGWKLTP
jgi:hypothetical protein